MVKINNNFLLKTNFFSIEFTLDFNTPVVLKTAIYIFLLMVSVLHINIKNLYGTQLIIAMESGKINSIEDLYHSKTILPGTVRNSFTELYFKASSILYHSFIN